MKVLITTVPFAERNALPIELLNSRSIDFLINPLNRKLTEDELANMVKDIDVIIAGTEPITEFVMANAPKLKLISRVGIGLDSVDLLAAKKRGIRVSYTPDAPAPAVAELTVGLIITLLRSVHLSNLEMHNGSWNRYFGKRIANSTIGIIGVGRIGSRVISRLFGGFGTPRVLVNDITPEAELERKFKIDWVDKETIYREADVISLHLPLTKLTKNLVTKKELEMMKKDAIILNTSRGGIINENDLHDVMINNHLSGAAVDVFESEPYSGPLNSVDNCILTAHMGSMSIDCRAKMEVEATEEVLRFVNNMPLENQVPKSEYDIQRI